MVKRPNKVHERVGLLNAHHGRVARHYDIDVVADPSGTRAAAGTGKSRPA